MGNCQSVGGVIVGETPETHRPQQLQRIISRCKCQFFFASYGEVDSSLLLSPTTAAVTDMLSSTEEVGRASFLFIDLSIFDTWWSLLSILRSGKNSTKWLHV